MLQENNVCSVLVVTVGQLLPVRVALCKHRGYRCAYFRGLLSSHLTLGSPFDVLYFYCLRSEVKTEMEQIFMTHAVLTTPSLNRLAKHSMVQKSPSPRETGCSSLRLLHMADSNRT